MTKNCVTGAVFMAAVFCFFYVGFVQWTALIFLRSFFLLYFFGFVSGGLSSTETNCCICIAVFCMHAFLLLMKNQCWLPAVTADLRPLLRLWLDGWGREWLTPTLKCSVAERQGVSHEARNTTWLLFWVDSIAKLWAGGSHKKQWIGLCQCSKPTAGGA